MSSLTARLLFTASPSLEERRLLRHDVDDRVARRAKLAHKIKISKFSEIRIIRETTINSQHTKLMFSSYFQI